MNTKDWIENTPQGVLIKVLAQPKASRSEVVGPHGDPIRLKIRIAAPPVDGEANEELLRFLKKTIRIPGIQLSIIRGETSKNKDVLCTGAGATEVREKLWCN